MTAAYRRFPASMSTAERITAGSVATSEGCWEWQRARIARDRYGVLSVNGVQTYAHRASYEAFVGPIPDGMFIDHLCMNKACVNPEHLEPVTPGENPRRATRIGHGHPNSPTACGRGHDWSIHPPRISRRADGNVKRDCSVCTADRNRRRRSA